jgi:hypothetical protein
MAWKGRREPPSEHPLTRGERRAQRKAAERQRMPQHGKALGIVVRNALLRRAGATTPRKPR